MRGSDFVRDSIDLLYYHLHKIGLKRGRSYIDSSGWLKNKKATINPENNDDNCFQNVLTVALNIGRNHQIISKIKPFTDQYNWNKINFALDSKGWKNLEQNNKTIAINILFVPYNTKKDKTCIQIKT